MRWDDDQRRAIETAGVDLCVDASAGSGKTSVLIERIVQLLEQRRADLDEIAAITFTDAAAGEMRERLRAEAAARERGPSPESRRFWRDISQRIEGARIGTFHSFCAGLLRENALQVGLDPEFGLLTDADAFLLREDAAGETIRGLLAARAPAVLLLASLMGMTRLIALLAAGLAQRGFVAAIEKHDPACTAEQVSAEWEVAVERARTETLCSLRDSVSFRGLLARLRKLGDGCRNPSDGRETARIKIIEAMDRLTRAESPQEVESCLQAILAVELTRGAVKNWPSEDFYKVLKKAQEEAVEIARECINPEADPELEQAAAEATAAFIQVFHGVLDRFRHEKTHRAVLDFDDLITCTVRMIETVPDAARRAARGLKYLLVDEFQDTDTEQYQIVELLKQANPRLEVFIVGDAKQSIYGFRGAEVEVFARAHEGKTVIPLANNYRSAPEILAFVNDFFRSTGCLSAVERAYRPMKAVRRDTASCRIEFLVPAAETAGSEGKDVQRSREAELIAARVQDMCSGADAVPVCDRAGTRQAAYGDAALLFRAYSSLHIYERALQDRNIPYQVVTGRGFYSRQEVQDMLNLLRVVIDPVDEMALLGFLRGPMGRLSDESLLLLCVNQSLLEAFDTGQTPQGFEQDTDFADARRLVQDLRERMEMPLPAFLRYLIERTGYEAIVSAQHLGVQKASNVRKMVTLAERFTQPATSRLPSFVRYVTEIGEREIPEGDAPLQSERSDAVTLMTIHHSKGLEFPIVVVPDLSRKVRGPDAAWAVADRGLGVAAQSEDRAGDRYKPLLYRWILRGQREKDAAESARLLYVAMTRARDYLLLGFGGQPERDSWQEPFDLAYDILARRDGEDIAGQGWRAIIRRMPSPPRLRKPAKEPIPAPDVETLRKQIAPVAAPSRRRRRFAAGEIAALIASDGQALAYNPVADEGSVSSLNDALDPIERGLLLHRALQKWDFRTDIDTIIDEVLRRERPAFRVRQAASPRLKRQMEWLLSTDVGRKMAESMKPCREYPFLLRMGEAVVAGVIDLLLEDGTIVDYKSGRRSDAHAAYEWQVRLYATALVRLGGRVASPAYLCYTDQEEIHPVIVTQPVVEETWDRACRVLDRLCRR